MQNSQFEHILIVDSDGKRQVYILDDQAFSIGRHSSNSLVLKSKVISRHHATILPFNSPEQKVDSFWIIDGNEQGIVSTNGLMVNEQPCLMHQLKPGDEIVFPENTKITYQIQEKLQDNDSDDDMPTGVIAKSEKIASKDNQFKVKTDFHLFLSSSRLDTRIYVQNITMLCLLLEKELELARSKNQLISLIFIFYDFNYLKSKYSNSYQRIIRIYQLLFNQKISNSVDFLLSFEQLEIIVLHGLNHQGVKNLVNEFIDDIEITTAKLNLPETESVLVGAYSQIPGNERNVKALIEKVSQILQTKANKSINNGDDLFIDLNLLRME